MDERAITRREALGLLGASVVSISGCLGAAKISEPIDPYGRIVARPAKPTQTIAAGMTPIPSLGVDGFLCVPPSYSGSKPAPLAVLFHGAGHDAHELIDPLASLADARGMIMLATRPVSFSID